MISKLIFGYKKSLLSNMYYGLVVMQLFLTQLLQTLLLSKKGDRYFLPGGGMEGTETKDECLHRELLEELGWAIEINQYIGNAMRYFYAEKEDTYYLNDGFFYIANMVQTQTENCEEDHVLRWMSPLLAVELLIHDHQKWAVEQALLLQKPKRISFYMKEILFIVNLLFSN